MKGQIRKTLVILVAVLLLVTLTSMAVSAKFDSTKTYKIMSLNSGKVLDVTGASKDDGAKVIQYEWHAGDNQRWRFIPLSGDDKGYYKIESVNSGKCLDISGGSKEAGANLIQFSWKNGVGVKNQEWKVTPLDTPNYVYTIACKHSNLVLDVPSGSLDNGVNIIQWGLNNGLNQKWLITVA
jgi:hypothetical protein